MTDTRKEDFLNGKTIVINFSIDKKKANPADLELMALAEQSNRLVYIGRKSFYRKLEASKWLNPSKPTEHTAMEHHRVIDEFKLHLQDKPELLAAIPELKGKVLACWCHPLPCHGNHLAELANQ